MLSPIEPLGFLTSERSNGKPRTYYDYSGALAACPEIGRRVLCDVCDVLRFRYLTLCATSSAARDLCFQCMPLRAHDLRYVHRLRTVCLSVGQSQCVRVTH